MARIAQRTINNIVIFAMLIMIALFNFDLFLPSTTQEQRVTLLPDDAYILKLEFDNYSIQRIANTFVYKGLSDGNSLQSAAEQVAKWQNIHVEPLQNGSAPNASPKMVRVWLASDKQTYDFAFYPWSQKHVALEYNENWFLIDIQTANSLFTQTQW